MIIMSSQLFSFELKVKEEKFNTLVVENKVLFRRIIKSINDQILGDEGDDISSKDYTPIDFYGNVELILNPFNLDCNSKKTQSKISSELKKIIHNSSYENRINIITTEFNKIASDLVQEFSFPSITNNEIESSNILKLLSFQIEPRDELLSVIIDYCNTKILSEGIKVFVFVNLKTFLSIIEFETLLNQFIYDKIPAIFIESSIKNEELTSLENVFIIDEELCEIYSDN